MISIRIIHIVQLHHYKHHVIINGNLYPTHGTASCGVPALNTVYGVDLCLCVSTSSLPSC